MMEKDKGTGGSTKRRRIGDNSETSDSRTVADGDLTKRKIGAGRETAGKKDTGINSGKAGSDRPKRSYGAGSYRPKRSYRPDSDRPKRSYSSDGERPKRNYGSDSDRPNRSYGAGSDRPKRSYGTDSDRPKRSYGSDSDKPKRSYGADSDRPKRRTGANSYAPIKEAGAGSDKTRRRFNPDGDKSRSRFGSGNGMSKKRSSVHSNTQKKNPADKESADGLIRLNRYIANSGVCARREADDLIVRGLIEVNGKKVTDLGTKVSRDDTVIYQGKKLEIGKKVYVLLNKPKGYVTTVKDPHAEFTVLDLVKDATDERIFPVGRLDKATTGVLLLTNDGDLTAKLTHPKFGAKKVYHVFLDHEVTKNDLETIVSGVELEEGIISADAVSFPEPDDRTQVGIEIHSGQNRIVRRIFEKLGYDVRKLDRVFFAGLTKKSLQRGTWRHLTPKEVDMLKRGIFS